MEKISKPELTNFLRYLDKKKLLFPRIRYASVRSKSEILVDMKKQFHARVIMNRIVFSPKRARVFPEVYYDLTLKRFSVNLEGYADIPQFSIKRGPVTVTF